MLERLTQSIDLQALMTRIAEYVPNIIGACLLVLLFFILNKIIRKTVVSAMAKTKVSEEATTLLLRFAKYALIVFGFLTVAGQLSINVGSLVAGVGIAGLALSFAAQDTIANLISGVAIIIDRPFKEGDWIAVGDMHASVAKIRLRTTTLTTFDNETVVVPNKQLAQERVVNFTLTPNARVRVSVGIAYKEDIQGAREVILSTLEGDARILPDPAPSVVVTGLGDSSVNLQLRFWTEDPNQKYGLMWEYTEKCKQALDQADIEIPFPHLQLFLEQTRAVETLAKAK
ncbi:MAG: mechanosensitive ion channel [Deltaproteobacteria bacterium]|nr:mechanosensitive ion channel [Deltaproteobacteria bacterium]